MPQTKQFMSALERGNEVRLRRGELKRDLNVLDHDAIDTLLDVPEWLENMTGYDFLMALPRVGRHRALKFLSEVPTSENRRIGEMTDRQRNVIHKIIVSRFVVR